LNIDVYGICGSSCANYLFLAGEMKILHGAIIGFHGSPTAARAVYGEDWVEKNIQAALKGSQAAYCDDPKVAVSDFEYVLKK